MNRIGKIGGALFGALFILSLRAASLPEGYRELEYVICTNTQYVDVGMKLKNTHRVEVVFAMATTASRKDRVYVFGGRSGTNSKNFEVFTGTSGELILDFNNSSYETTRLTYTGFQKNVRYYVCSGRDKREIRSDNATGELLKSDYEPIADTFETAGNCYLMRCNSTQGYTMFMGRVYSFRITDQETGKSVRDFVPCRRVSDGAVGFFDVADHSADASYEPFYASATANGLQDGPLAIAGAVYLTETDSITKDATAGNNHSCWTNAVQWSDKSVPQAGKSYYVKRIDDVIMNMRSPYSKKSDATSYEFPGDVVYVDRGCAVALPTHLVSFKRLELLPGSSLVSPATSSEATVPNLILDGDIRFPAIVANPEPVSLKVHCGRMLRVDGEIRGGGVIRLDGQEQTGSPAGIYYFSAENSDFTGRIIVSENAENVAPDYEKTNQTLRVKAELNLGGRCPAFDAKALTLERCGTFAVYQVADTLELTTNYNRGVFVNGKGRIRTVPDGNYGNSLRLSTRLTLNGELRKEGSGTLTLAAVGECEGPSSVDLAEGSLALENARALDGADLVIGEGASVSLKLDVADAYCREYGCRLGTITLPAGATELPISLSVTAVPAELKRRAFSLGILTAPTETVNALRSRLTLPPKPVPGYRLVKTDVRDNGDGTSTYFADFEPNGLILIFR